METILKMFNQYDIRVNFIPGCVVYYLLRIDGFDFMIDGEVEKVILCYLIGMLTSRIGSLLVENSCKKFGCIKFVKYKLYMEASKKNEKIDILSETNNLYRSMIAAFLVVALYVLTVYGLEKSKLLVPILGMIIFFISYIKQTGYISKNVMNTIKLSGNDASKTKNKGGR